MVAPNGRAKDVKTVVHLPRFVYASVHKGDKVGDVEYWYNDTLIARTDILAGSDAQYVKAECKGFLEDIKSKIVSLFS
jgi:hypothetical protein